MAADPSADTSWKTPGFRQKVMGQIEDAVRLAGNPTKKSCIEMENHVFQKAKSREEYLGLVARLIIHVRDINSKKEKAAGQMMSGQGMPQQPMQDPINALQNLAKQPPAMASMPGMPVGGMNPQQQMRGQPMQQQMMQPMQQQMMQQRPQQPGVHADGYYLHPQVNRPQNLPLTMQSPQQDGIFMPRQAMPGQMMQGGPMHVQGPRPDAFMIQQQNQYNMGGMQRQFQGQMQGQIQQQPASQPNSVGQMSQQQSPAPPGSYHIHSPANMIPTPSPGSQIVRSPAPRQNMGAPSPGSIQLNTPGNPGSVGSSTDDQAYLDKLKQLSKYIEPLRKMIAKIDKDEDTCRKKDLSKMTNLLEILSDSSKRLPMSTLLKCEEVLEKLNFSRSAGISSGQKEQHMCQPLLDAISSHMRSPILNHTLQRTFGPAVQMLHGPPLRAPSPPSKRRKYEETTEDSDDDDDIPYVLQGEIGRLEQRFRVSLDPAFHIESKCVHLVCRLEDRKLPSVPPINITVPSDYPSSSPQCVTGEENYTCTPFLNNVHKTLTYRLNRMPAKYSVTALLDTWELSVRQACAPSS